MQPVQPGKRRLAPGTGLLDLRGRFKHKDAKGLDPGLSLLLCEIAAVESVVIDAGYMVQPEGFREKLKPFGYLRLS